MENWIHNPKNIIWNQLKVCHSKYFKHHFQITGCISLENFVYKYKYNRQYVLLLDLNTLIHSIKKKTRKHNISFLNNPLRSHSLNEFAILRIFILFHFRPRRQPNTSPINNSSYWSDDMSIKLMPIMLCMKLYRFYKECY